MKAKVNKSSVMELAHRMKVRMGMKHSLKYSWKFFQDIFGTRWSDSSVSICGDFTTWFAPINSLEFKYGTIRFFDVEAGGFRSLVIENVVGVYPVKQEQAERLNKIKERNPSRSWEDCLKMVEKPLEMAA